jgi:ParB family chromosome partitioning protein
MVNLLSSSGDSDGAQNAEVKSKPLNTIATEVLKEGAKENARLLEMIHGKYAGGTALPCLNLDPSKIRVGRFFNRLPQSFDETLNVEFAELLEDVRRTGGNLVSGLVRPYVDESNPKIKYELVFGERRLKACIKAGVPFKAEIAEITESEFIHLHSTENRFRPQLSIVESALQFKSWVGVRKDAEGKKVPVETLAAEIGYSRTHYFRLQEIGNIDEDVLFSIPGVELLARRDIEPLCKAWKRKDGKESIIKRARELKGMKLGGKDAIAYLLNDGGKPDNTTSNKITIKVPSMLPNKSALIDRLRALGVEFGIEFSIK